MSLIGRELWWLTPLQAFAVVGTAANFGGSVLQTPLIMPMLKLDAVPIHHIAYQTRYLLHESEKFFPPLNALCTLSNLVVGVTAYLNRNSNATLSAKLPYALAGFALNMATTGWALMVMVPMNKSMARDAAVLEKDTTNANAAKSFKQTQARWQNLNLVRASFMMAASVTALLGLLADDALLKLSTR